MGRLILIVVALLALVTGWESAAAASAGPLPGVPVGDTYAYDSVHRTSSPSYTTTERGSPKHSYTAASNYGAVNHWSSGASAHPETSAAYTDDHRVQFVHGGSTGAAPGQQTSAADAGLSWSARTGVAAKSADNVVLGHYPEYVDLAKAAGGRTFQVPKSVWDKMSPAEQWGANQKFLDRAIARGSNVQLATPANAAREGSFFERELQYMQSRGYTVGPDGMSLIAPGGP